MMPYPHQQPPAAYFQGGVSPFGSPAPPPGRGAPGAQAARPTHTFPRDSACDTCGVPGHGHRNCRSGLPRDWFRQQQPQHGAGAQAGAGGHPQQLQLLPAPPRG
jgi:hypothetical protein